MKKIVIILILICLTHNLSAEEIKFVKLSEDPWPPFTYGETIPTGGYAIEFTKAIFKELNIGYEIRLYPWKRCLQQMKDGTRDGVILSGINKERQGYMIFTDPIMYDRDLIWYSASRETPVVWDDFEDLKNYTIATTLGFSYGKSFEEAAGKYMFKIDYANNDLQNFKKILSGRNDIFICNETVAMGLFKNNPEFKGKFKSAQKPLKEVTLHMAFSKNSNAAALVPRINKIIQKLHEKGTFEEILKN